MKTGFNFRNVAVWSAVFLTSCLVIGAQPETEQQFIGVLKSNASPKEKDGACQGLKRIGTAKCVPAVAELLTDEQLSHSARYVLETLPWPEAGAALLDALANTSGQLKMGIICSLGVRGDAGAVPVLTKLAEGADQQMAVAATLALGHMVTVEASRSLESLAGRPAGPVHDAAVEGLLRYANRLVTLGQMPTAAGIFNGVFAAEAADRFQLAAYRGMIRSAGAESLTLVTNAVVGPPGPAQLAALQMAREVEAPGVAATLAGLLPHVDVPVQVALVETLEQRGDPTAGPGLLNFLSSGMPEVRVVILKALGVIGDASAVPVLAQYAASGTPGEQAASRQALLDVRRGDVVDTMLRQLSFALPEVRAELTRALGERGEKQAMPWLLKLARAQSDVERVAAIKALGMLIGEQQIGDLVALVLDAPDAETRARAAEALNGACQRIALEQGTIDAVPFAVAATQGSKEARIALLPICSGLIAPEVQLCLRHAVLDRDPEVAATAVRALCNTIDPDLIEDVLALARLTGDETFRALAIAGGVRLLTQEETVKISIAQRVTSLKLLLGVASRPEEKKLVLAGLGMMPDLEALRAIEPALQDANLRSEAILAAVKIAPTLSGAQAREALEILQKALPESEGPARQALEAALKRMRDSIDYVTDWVVAGPFRQEGKDYAALFDTAFAPETGNSAAVEWRALAAGTDPERPYVMDILKVLSGQQCVAYARTWVRCDKDVEALLELGTDDGVKVWVNEKQVYALNAARPLQPGSDKVNLNLHSGWNRLVLKITQNNQGWEFCARLVNPDGSPLEGVQVQAAPKTISEETPEQPER